MKYVYYSVGKPIFIILVVVVVCNVFLGHHVNGKLYVRCGGIHKLADGMNHVGYEGGAVISPILGVALVVIVFRGEAVFFLKALHKPFVVAPVLRGTGEIADIVKLEYVYIVVFEYVLVIPEQAFLCFGICRVDHIEVAVGIGGECLALGIHALPFGLFVCNAGGGILAVLCADIVDRHPQVDLHAPVAAGFYVGIENIKALPLRIGFEKAALRHGGYNIVVEDRFDGDHVYPGIVKLFDKLFYLCRVALRRAEPYTAIARGAAFGEGEREYSRFAFNGVHGTLVFSRILVAFEIRRGFLGILFQGFDLFLCSIAVEHTVCGDGGVVFVLKSLHCKLQTVCQRGGAVCQRERRAVELRRHAHLDIVADPVHAVAVAGNDKAAHACRDGVVVAADGNYNAVFDNGFNAPFVCFGGFNVLVNDYLARFAVDIRAVDLLCDGVINGPVVALGGVRHGDGHCALVKVDIAAHGNAFHDLVGVLRLCAVVVVVARNNEPACGYFAVALFGNGNTFVVRSDDSLRTPFVGGGGFAVCAVVNNQLTLLAVTVHTVHLERDFISRSTKRYCRRKRCRGNRKTENKR